MGFQTSVNLQQAPAVAGDFASGNPRATLPAGEGSVVAGDNGVNIGRFAWVVQGVAGNSGSAKPAGLVGRDNQAVITAWLADGTQLINKGLPVTVHVAGDFWVKTLTSASIGQKVFASLTTGEVKTDAAGATVSGYVETGWTVTSTALANELIKISTWGV